MLGWGPPPPKSEVERLAARYTSRLRLSTAFNTEFFFLNTRLPPFDDVRVRRAVFNAFDPRCPHATEGPPSGRPVGSSRRTSRAINRPVSITPAGFSRGSSRARKQVASAGAAGAHVTVWILTLIRERAEYVASLLRSIGLRADVKTVEPVAGPQVSPRRSPTPRTESRWASPVGWPTTPRPRGSFRHSSAARAIDRGHRRRARTCRRSATLRLTRR